MDDSTLPPAEQVLASAAQFLIDGHEDNAASVLLACTLALEFDNGGYGGNHYYSTYDAVLAGPRAVFDALRQSEQVRDAIKSALNAVLPSNTSIGTIMARAMLVELSPDWHE